MDQLEQVSLSDLSSLQPWEDSRLSPAGEKPVPDAGEVRDVLDEVCRKALSFDGRASLERYYRYHFNEPGFRDEFIRDFSSAREVFLHRDDDRAPLAYTFSLASLILSVGALAGMDANVGLAASAMVVCLLFSVTVLLFAWVPQLVHAVVIKFRKRGRNMEEFYRYICRHV